MGTTEKKLSKVEAIKRESDSLRGNIAAEMADSNDFVSDESYELLKFHGSYQGYDRDSATERKKAGLDKEWEFMLRMKCPGGRLSPTQYLALDKIAEDYANGTLRITTRETFQFHCIIKKNLKKHIQALNDIMLTSLGGCGDVVRNIMCTPAPIADEVHRVLLEDTYKVNDFTMPTTTGFEEIWLDKTSDTVKQGGKDAVDPLYGETYLPRKFKIGLASPEDNSIDALTHDLAFIMIHDGDDIKGYNVYVGGGLGMTHNKENTYPRLASPVAFITREELLPMTKAVIELQKEYGNRADRKAARLKYVVEEKGVEWTRKTLAEYYGKPLVDPVAINTFKVVDHMGWHEQKDGKYYLGVAVPSGRIADYKDAKYRSGLYNVIEKYNPNIVLTADQNITLADLEAKDKDAIYADLRSYGIKLREDITSANRDMLACVALPTCGKALAEAERIQVPLLGEIEPLLAKHGLKEQRIAIRIAGCPNGCSRPYAGEIGIVGRMPGHYALFIGGDFEGTRLSSKILDRVPYDHVPTVLDVLFERYAAEKQTEEMFGEFCSRIGVENILDTVKERLGGEYKWAA